jgi:hypothetical protein
MEKRPEATMYDDGTETNIYSIAEDICSQPPKPPCSIQFMMDNEVESSEFTDMEFDILKTYTMACMKILFGATATPKDLNTEQYDLLNNYVKSIGYRLDFDVEETETSYKYKISFEKYKSSKPNPFEHLKNFL